jgi:hypothetical protein
MVALANMHKNPAATCFILISRNRSKLPQPHSARAPESLTTFAHFGISRAM